jgi:hypothetical protein
VAFKRAGVHVTRPLVSHQDVEKAKAESWWGDPIVVRPEQIFTK